MPVSLALVAPAALAAAAYLNAKSSLTYDLAMLRAMLTTHLRIQHATRHDRLNLFYALETLAQSPTHADRPFLLFEHRRHTYSDFYHAVLRHAAHLRHHLAVQPGAIVALDFHNSDTFLLLWFALWALGAKPAFLNYNLAAEPLAHCVAASTARLCLLDPAVIAAHTTTTTTTTDLVADLRTRLPNVNFVVWTPELAAAAHATAPVRPPDADRSESSFSNMAILIFTSGTTGLPKAAIVPWSRCIGGGTIASSLLRRGRRPDDVMYTSMPLYHGSASLLAVCATLLSGATQALGRRFSTSRFWPEVRQHRATSILYVGETLRYLLAAPPLRDPVTGHNLDRCHHVVAALGNGLRPDIWDRFKHRFGIQTVAEFYGSTEGTFATWNVSSNQLSSGAVGRIGWLRRFLTRNNVALVEHDHDTGLPLRDPTTGFCRRVQNPTQPGEALSRLDPNDLDRLYQGYLGNAAASQSKVLRDVFAPGDAWFRTGDLLTLDPDGFFSFSDRIGDTFRWKSENVSTNEVAHAVGTFAPVREANVYGVQLPHHDGRAGCVAINFAQPPDAETLRGLAAHVRAALPRYALPLFLRVVTDIAGPHTTGTNKQQKHVLREAGVDPNALNDGANLYWLKGDTYQSFGDKEWQDLQAGRVKL